jgi:hypothetical protein
MGNKAFSGPPEQRYFLAAFFHKLFKYNKKKHRAILSLLTRPKCLLLLSKSLSGRKFLQITAFSFNRKSGTKKIRKSYINTFF